MAANGGYCQKITVNGTQYMCDSTDGKRVELSKKFLKKCRK